MIDLLGTVKRKVFISYHHGGAQYYCDRLQDLVLDKYDVATDRSVDRKIDSGDPEYVMRRIREHYITGTSCTIVLVSENAYQRKYIDWEIKATLDKGHGLVALYLPSAKRHFLTGGVIMPERLQDNISNGCVVEGDWIDTYTKPDRLKLLIESSINSVPLVRNNSRPLMKENNES